MFYNYNFEIYSCFVLSIHHTHLAKYRYYWNYRRNYSKNLIRIFFKLFESGFVFSFNIRILVQILSLAMRKHIFYFSTNLTWTSREKGTGNVLQFYGVVRFVFHAPASLRKRMKRNTNCGERRSRKKKYYKIQCWILQTSAHLCLSMWTPNVTFPTYFFLFVFARG